LKHSPVTPKALHIIDRDRPRALQNPVVILSAAKNLLWLSTLDYKPLTPHTAPTGSGYYLQVRAKKDSTNQPIRWNTPGFSLSPTAPESDVLIVLPEAL
jgi:hypothetical protein